MAIKTFTGGDLEERAADPEALRAAIAQCRRDLAIARQRVKAPDAGKDWPGIEAREVGRLADLLRLDGQRAESEALFVEAIGLWAGLGKARAGALARLRLAQVCRADGRCDEARAHLDALFEAMVDDENLNIYKDFVLYHRGVTAWRAGRQESAIEDLSAALAIRAAEASKLTATTEEALRIVRAGPPATPEEP